MQCTSELVNMRVEFLSFNQLLLPGRFYHLRHRVVYVVAYCPIIKRFGGSNVSLTIYYFINIFFNSIWSTYMYLNIRHVLENQKFDFHYLEKIFIYQIHMYTYILKQIMPRTDRHSKKTSTSLAMSKLMTWYHKYRDTHVFKINTFWT